MIVEVLFGAGLRVSEACTLKINDLHLDGNEPSLFIRHGKGGRPRLVPISLVLANYLGLFLETKEKWGESIEPTQPLFVGQHGVELTRWGVTKIWKSALRTAGLPNNWGVHATRHSYGVEIYRQTRDIRLTQRLLGHASVLTTMVYASLLDETVRAGVERLWA